MSRDEIERLVRILNKLAESGKEADFYNEYEKMLFDYDRDEDMLLQSGCHIIGHFVADLDIRQKDSEYDRCQRQELLELAAKIRQKYLSNDS